MKKVAGILAVTAMLIISCNTNQEEKTPVLETEDTTVVLSDSAIIIDKDAQPVQSAIYGNNTFRNVKVNRFSADSATITGEARVFEAVFGWSIEDGHNELTHGFTTASIGAPEWGSFSFNIPTKKQEQNTTLTLLIFENSAADDSRTHQLSVPIP